MTRHPGSCNLDKPHAGLSAKGGGFPALQTQVRTGVSSPTRIGYDETGVWFDGLTERPKATR